MGLLHFLKYRRDPSCRVRFIGLNIFVFHLHFRYYKIDGGDSVKNPITIVERIIRLLNKVNQVNKIPRDYGTEHLLYPSEIHTIEAIKNHENVNASELSTILGITNGAITQIVTKLKQKGLVEQYHTLNNKKEVYYCLTTQGTVAHLGHAKYHEESYKELNQYIESLSEEEAKSITRFLDKLITHWPLK